MIKASPSLVEPPIESLVEKIGSRFELAVMAGKRARQINLYYSSLGQSIRGLVPPQVASLSDNSLTISLEEIAKDKLISRQASEILAEQDSSSGSESGEDVIAIDDNASSDAANSDTDTSSGGDLPA
jgi:DNA-directed RNA polymerase subunit omega